MFYNWTDIVKIVINQKVNKHGQKIYSTNASFEGKN